MAKYQIITYYARNHIVEKDTKEEAMAFIVARGMSNHTPHYTELWKVADGDGNCTEQIGCWESSQIQMLPGKNLLTNFRAQLKRV